MGVNQLLVGGQTARGQTPMTKYWLESQQQSSFIGRSKMQLILDLDHLRLETERRSAHWVSERKSCLLISLCILHTSWMLDVLIWATNTSATKSSPCTGKDLHKNLQKSNWFLALKLYSMATDNITMLLAHKTFLEFNPLMPVLSLTATSDVMTFD